MFVGKYYNSIDNKSRLIVPAKFRDELGGRCVVAKSLDKCLVIYTKEEWQKVLDQCNGVRLTQSGGIRFLLAKAWQCEPDKQGRVLLPQRLRDFAGMTSEVVANGVMTRVELWSKEGWEAYLANASEGYDEALEKLAEFGI
jgi:MraZ protein